MNNYVLSISVILNGILLIVLFGTIPFFLYLSVLINLGLLWYIRKVLEKNSDIEEDIEEVMDKITNFSDHLEGVHELEMYYGDENLQNMIRHSRELVNEFVDFQLKYFDTEEIFDTEEDFDPYSE
jgi:hypothetical protein